MAGVSVAIGRDGMLNQQSFDLHEASSQFVDQHLGGGSYWCGKRAKERCFGLGFYPPVLSVLAAAACVVLLYADLGWNYTVGVDGAADTPWWTALAAQFSHVDEVHLWENAIMTILLGCFLEATEGPFRAFAIMWGGGLVGFGLVGTVVAPQPVRGFSAALYSLMWAQLALLALNWKEMPLRWLRLGMALVLLAAELLLFFALGRGQKSLEAHGFGALAGIALALTLGDNLRVHHWELSFRWAGVAAYAALCAAAIFAARRVAAGGLAAAVAPFQLGYAAYRTWRACRRTKADPQRPVQTV